jgi:hypothetical protein
MLAALLLHIALALPPASLSPDAMRAALGELSAIWSAHGVAVTSSSDECRSADTVVIRVVIEPRPPSLGSDWSGALASIKFGENGEPRPVIALYLPNLIAMIARSNLTAGGREGSPVVLRERAIGRAVGRVLAHELGHYLLRSRSHARSGLMRSIQSAADLVDAGRESFGLSAPEMARLAEVMSPAAVGPAAADHLARSR